MEILRELFQKQDVAYRDFQLALIPTVRKERIIGVRTPELRAMAKALRGSDEAAAFLRRLPHLPQPDSRCAPPEGTGIY